MTSFLTRNETTKTLDLVRSDEFGLVVSDAQVLSKLNDVTLNDGEIKIKTHLSGQTANINVDVQNFPATQVVSMAKSTSGYEGNLTLSVNVLPNDMSNVVDCSTSKSGKVIFMGGNLGVSSSVLVQVSEDGVKYFNDSEIQTTIRGTDRWGTINLDLSTVNHVRLVYSESELVTATLLLGA